MKKKHLKFLLCIIVVTVISSFSLTAFAGTALVQRFDGNEGADMLSDPLKFSTYLPADGGGACSFTYTQDKAKMGTAAKITATGLGSNNGAYVNFYIHEFESRDWSKAEYIEFYVNMNQFRSGGLFFSIVDGNNHKYEVKKADNVIMVEKSPGYFKEEKTGDSVWLDKTFKGRVRYKATNFITTTVSPYSPADKNSEIPIDWGNIKSFSFGFNQTVKDGTSTDIGKYIIIDNFGINGAAIAYNYEEPVVSSTSTSSASSSSSTTSKSSTLSTSSNLSSQGSSSETSSSQESSSELSTADASSSSTNVFGKDTDPKTGKPLFWIIPLAIVILGGAGAAVYFFVIKKKI